MEYLSRFEKSGGEIFHYRFPPKRKEGYKVLDMVRRKKKQTGIGCKRAVQFVITFLFTFSKKKNHSFRRISSNGEYHAGKKIEFRLIRLMHNAA